MSLYKKECNSDDFRKILHVFLEKLVTLHLITIIGLTWKSKTSVEDDIDSWYRCHDILEGVYLTLVFGS